MHLDDEMQEALATFTVESFELLQDMEDNLLGLEDEAEPGERINAIFRAAHTIKGSSGLFGLNHVVRFTHVVESVLDELRAGKLTVTPELVALLLPCCDHITVLIKAVAEGNIEEDPDTTADGQHLLVGLQAILDGGKDTQLTQFTVEPAQIETVGGGLLKSGNWHISLRFGADCLRNGMDPLSFVRYLSTLGEVVNITTITANLPQAEQMDAETCYLGFEINIKSDANKETLEQVFEFVREDSVIQILPLESSLDDFIQLIQNLPEDDNVLGEILVKSGVLTHRELEECLTKQKANLETHHSSPPLGEMLVEQKVVQQPLVNAALDKQKQVKDSKARENQSIRIDAERLDKLIDLVGELVIAGAGVNLQALEIRATALLEASGEMMRLVEEVRDSALQLRMVPISTTFNRFQRVVREVSTELGKDIALQITGGDTEVDKTIVEKIGDPLMHLVRNAMDHGIEFADIREQNGKPRQGILRLNAFHESGSIVIEVGDDGGGLNKERILAKALERGMITGEAKLSDQEVYALIFEPGFSTAQQISNLSGRGVGMDVVKRNVTDLRGTIEVTSNPGLGSTIRIRLPLTLAIIDGFLVSVGNASFVIPLDRVHECVELPVTAAQHEYMDLRGEVLPLIRLRGLFEIEGPSPRRENVVVTDYAGHKTGFIVDWLHGEFQTVIKPLGKLFAHIKGVAGSTILGNGKVALILDVPNLVAFVEDKGNSAQHRLNHHSA